MHDQFVPRPYLLNPSDADTKHLTDAFNPLGCPMTAHACTSLRQPWPWPPWPCSPLSAFHRRLRVPRRPTHPSRSVPVAVGALSRLLRERPARVLVQRAGAVQLLAPLLRAGGGVAPTSTQLLYEVSLCTWQLTYHPPAAEAMGPAGVVPGLVDLVRVAAKEKVGPAPAPLVP